MTTRTVCPNCSGTDTKPHCDSKTCGWTVCKDKKSCGATWDTKRRYGYAVSSDVPEVKSFGHHPRPPKGGLR